jgi:hypothetical protein
VEDDFRSFAHRRSLGLALSRWGFRRDKKGNTYSVFRKEFVRAWSEGIGLLRLFLRMPSARHAAGDAATDLARIRRPKLVSVVVLLQQAEITAFSHEMHRFCRRAAIKPQWPHNLTNEY